MQAESNYTTTKEWCGPYVWLDYGDGLLIGEAVEVTRVTDLRDTAFGKVNFGHVIFGDRKFVTKRIDIKKQTDRRGFLTTIRQFLKF